MSRIFLSHSSGNNAEAIALRDWLISHGWDDLFLDLDPERGLKAGERWQAALKQAAERCELVIFLVSPEWAASKWCVAEFLLAKNLNKRIFGVIVEPTPLADLPVEMTAEWQLVDLTAGKRDHQVDRHAAARRQDRHCRFRQGWSRPSAHRPDAGRPRRTLFCLATRETIPTARPIAALQPLEAEDAGIFFGRDGPTVVGLDLLRGLREAAPPAAARDPRRIGRRQVVLLARRAASETCAREPALSPAAGDQARARGAHRRVGAHRELWRRL